MNTRDDLNASSVEEVDQEEEFEGMIYPRGLRFKSGEELICGVYESGLDWSSKKFINVNQPMVIDADGCIVPWSKIANVYDFEIATDMLRSMYEVRDSFLDKYMDACEQQHIGFLKEDLNRSDLDEEEREEIEHELAMITSGQPTEDAPPSIHHFMAISQTRH
jgi:hypothetical protein